MFLENAGVCFRGLENERKQVTSRANFEFLSRESRLYTIDSRHSTVLKYLFLGIAMSGGWRGGSRKPPLTTPQSSFHSAVCEPQSNNIKNMISAT